MNLPNKLTLTRIFLIPVFTAVYLLKVLPINFILSAIIFAIASLTDFLDGYIARKNNLVTNLGKFFFFFSDKILVSTALIIMLVPVKDGVSILPWYSAIAVAVILARELMVSGFRIIASSKGTVLAADKAGKIKTFCQDIAILVLLVGADVNITPYSIMNLIGLILLGVATVLTIISGAECIIKNKTVLKD